MWAVAIGTVVKTTKHWISVSVCIGGRTELLVISQSQFYSFNVQCVDDLTNLLEEGMEVQVCYKADNATEVQCAWIGDRPAGLDVEEPQKPVYDQQGTFSFVWKFGFVIDSHLGNVWVKQVNFFWNGRRTSEIATPQDEVRFDAIPAKDISCSSAKYVATCAWVGRKPTMVERFWPQSEITFVEMVYPNSIVDGTMRVIISESVAIADTELYGRYIQVLVMRSSFGWNCDRLQDVVNIGDSLRMRIMYRDFSQRRKLWYAEEAFKPIDATLDFSFETADLVETLAGENGREPSTVQAENKCVELPRLVCSRICKSGRTFLDSGLKMRRFKAKTTSGKSYLCCPGTSNIGDRVIASRSKWPRHAFATVKGNSMCIDPVLNGTATLNTGEVIVHSGLETLSLEADEAVISCAGPLDLSCSGSVKTGECAFPSSLDVPRVAFKVKSAYVKPLDLSCPAGTLKNRVFDSVSLTSRFEAVKTMTPCAERTVLKRPGTFKLEKSCVHSAFVSSRSGTDEHEATCAEHTVIICPETPKKARSVADSAFETPSCNTVQTETTFIEPIVLNCPGTLDAGQNAYSGFEAIRCETGKYDNTCIEPVVSICPGTTVDTVKKEVDSYLEMRGLEAVQAQTLYLEPVLLNPSMTIDTAESVVGSGLETPGIEAVKAETLCVEPALSNCAMAMDTAENVVDSGLETSGIETVKAETLCVEPVLSNCPIALDTAENVLDSGLETSGIETVKASTLCVEPVLSNCPIALGTAENAVGSDLETPRIETSKAETSCVEPVPGYRWYFPMTAHTTETEGDSGLKTPIPKILYEDPPLTGVISQFEEHASITFVNFNIFLDRSNLYVDGKVSGDFLESVICVSGKGLVKFEAVKSNRYPGFTHEATLAWIGDKPDLDTIAALLPVPRFELLKECRWNFCGIVRKLLLPNVALIEIPGLCATVAAFADSFNIIEGFPIGPRLISDCIELNDCVQFTVGKFPHSVMLCARNIRRVWCSETTLHLVRSGRISRVTRKIRKKFKDLSPDQSCSKNSKNVREIVLAKPKFAVPNRFVL